MECLWVSHHTFKHLVQNGETFRNETAPLLLRNMQECIVLCNYFNWSKQTKWLAILCVKNKFHNINVFLVELFYKSNIVLSMFSEYHHDIWKTCVDCFGDFGEFATSHFFALSFRLYTIKKQTLTHHNPSRGYSQPSMSYSWQHYFKSSPWSWSRCSLEPSIRKLCLWTAG